MTTSSFALLIRFAGNGCSQAGSLGRQIRGDEVRLKCRFLGDRGRIFVNPGGVYGRSAEELAENPLSADAWRAYPSNNHMANFFECTRTREQPCAPVDVEHRTMTACHLTNIAMRLGRKLTWDPETEAIVGDDEADAWQRYEQRAPYTLAIT